MSAISAISTNSMPQPTWSQTQIAAKITAIALVVLGTLGTLLSISTLVAGIGSVTLAVGLVSLACSLALIAIGIPLFNKQCWGDPQYVKNAVQQAKSLPLNQVVKKYGWENIYKYNLLSKSELTEKLLKEVHTYKEAVDKYGKQISGQVFNNSALGPLLLKQEREMDWDTFLKKFGNQAMDDKVITYDQLNEELNRQLDELGFIAFFERHQKLIPFSCGIPWGNYRDRFENEMKEVPLSKICQMCCLEKLINYRITSPEFLRSRSKESLGWSFDRILANYGRAVIREKILGKEEIQRPFLENAKNYNFFTFWGKYGSLVTFLDEKLSQEFKQLHVERERAESSYKYNINHLGQYDTIIKQAEEAFDAIKGAKTTQSVVQTEWIFVPAYFIGPDGTRSEWPRSIPKTVTNIHHKAKYSETSPEYINAKRVYEQAVARKTDEINRISANYESALKDIERKYKEILT